MEKFAQAGEFCPNESCPDYGKVQAGQTQQNIIKSGKTANGTQRHQCKTCNRTFTETYGIIFYRKRTPEHEILETLAFSKTLHFCRAAAIWEDCYYNLIRPHKSLRQPDQISSVRKWKPTTPAMAARLTDHIWTVKELFYSQPIPSVSNT